jgi:hypothetical protein
MADNYGYDQNRSGSASRPGDACPVDTTSGTTVGTTTSTTATPGYTAQGRMAAEPDLRMSPDRSSAGYASQQGRSFVGLVREFTRELTTLMRQEVALAKVEMRENLNKALRNAVYIALGGLLAFGAFMVLLSACVTGLGSAMEKAGVDATIYSWLSPLIIAVIVGGAGAALIMKGIKTFKDSSLAPRRTAQSLRETGEWVKEKVA